MSTRSGSGRRRSRPGEQDSITEERRRRILTYIRAGVFDHVAAQAVGISPRTFRDWIARGEDRGQRPATPELARFAQEVRAAKAEARIAAEVRVYREQPAYWLSRAARTRDTAEGWTEPAGTERGELTMEQLRAMSEEELANRHEQAIAGLVADGLLWSPPCSSPRCRCEFHVWVEERVR
jgi:hypothetical protein